MLAINRQRHDHVAIAIIGATDRCTLGIGQLHLDGRGRVEHPEEVTDEPRIKFDANGFPFMLDRQFNPTLTTLGRSP